MEQPWYNQTVVQNMPTDYIYFALGSFSIANVKKLLKTGKTYKIQGFISKKSGKSFDAYLKIDDEKKVVFDFND